MLFSLTECYNGLQIYSLILQWEMDSSTLLVSDKHYRLMLLAMRVEMAWLENGVNANDFYGSNMDVGIYFVSVHFLRRQYSVN